MITSALAGEGKSTIAANLGFSLAMTGKKVLLVDANLRAPWLHMHFKLEELLMDLPKCFRIWRRRQRLIAWEVRRQILTRSMC